MYYLDIVVGGLLVLGFFRGFSAGFWKCLVRLAGTIAGLVVAWLFTSPVVTYLENRYYVLTLLADWWKDVFTGVPGLNIVAQESTGAEFLSGLESISWLEQISGFIQENISQIQNMAGPGSSWGQVLAYGLAVLLVSGVVFLILLSLVRGSLWLFAGTLNIVSSFSMSNRLLGGVLEFGVSVFWMSLIIGTLYPLLGLPVMSGIRDSVSASWLVSVLMGVYRTFWAGIVGRIIGI